MSKPKIPEVLPLLRDYAKMQGNGAGGWLHCILDDGNVEDKDVKWCIGGAKSNGDKESVKLGKLLLRMSKTQRRKLAWMFYEL